MAMKRFEKDPSHEFEKIRETVALIREKTDFIPDVALVLGTGLGNTSSKIKNKTVFEYSSLPHFPKVTVESHSGKLILGELGGKKVAAMEGRFHFYEGYSLNEVTFPIRVLRGLGVKILIVSNAAGGLNLAFQKGDIVVIEDQINFMGANPLVGPNIDKLGPRFPDMNEPFSKRLLNIANDAALENKISIRRGVYIGVSGPCLETRAEYRMMRGFGADLVGMSTVPEVIAAIHMGMEVLGFSVVTDLCDPDNLSPCDIKEIIKTANAAGPRLDTLITSVISKLNSK